MTTFAMKEIEAMQRQIEAELNGEKVEKVPNAIEEGPEAWLELGEVSRCVSNSAKCSEKRCEECLFEMSLPVEIKFDRIYTTREAFLLEANGLNFSIVQPKGPDFEAKEAELPDAVAEKISNLGIEQPKSFFVRTWSEEQTRRHPEGWRFLEFMKPEHANALIVFTIWERLPLEVERWKVRGFCRHTEHTFGSIDYGFAKTSEDIDGPDFGYEYWIFQYDPKTEQLRIPSDPAEDKIDTFLQRQKVFLKLQPLKGELRRYSARRDAVCRALAQVEERARLRDKVELLEAMFKCFEVTDGRSPDELRLFFTGAQGTSIVCGQVSLLEAAQACVDDPSEKNLVKIRQVAQDSLKKMRDKLTKIEQAIQESEFADWGEPEFHIEIDRLDLQLDELQSQIRDLLAELGVDAESAPE